MNNYHYTRDETHLQVCRYLDTYVYTLVDNLVRKVDRYDDDASYCQLAIDGVGGEEATSCILRACNVMTVLSISKHCTESMYPIHEDDSLHLC